MYKSILVPVESSDAKESASTVELAQKYGSEDTKIHLLSVFDEIPKWASPSLPKDIVNDSIRAVEQSLQNIADKAGSHVTAEVKVGHAYKTILEVAEAMSADLIIVASHQPDEHHFFLGSTAAKVVRHARCSVLVLR